MKQTEKHEHVDSEKENAIEFLESFQLGKSAVPGEISPRLLWEAREEISEALAMIFGSSMETWEIPED